jgi:hypothetical protein
LVFKIVELKRDKVQGLWQTEILNRSYNLLSTSTLISIRLAYVPGAVRRRNMNQTFCQRYYNKQVVIKLNGEAQIAKGTLREYNATYSVLEEHSRTRKIEISEINDIELCETHNSSQTKITPALSAKLGIKIYLGNSTSTNNNISRSLEQPIDIKQILDDIKHKPLKETVSKLLVLQTPIYCWAAISKIARGVGPDENVIFINHTKRKALCFSLQATASDPASEIQKAVNWTGHGFESVVFFTEKKEIDLSIEQLNEIERLTHATYQDKGFAGFKHDNVIYGETARKLATTLFKECSHEY